MPATIFAMLVILAVAAAIIAVVVMGMEGQGRDQHPEIADAMARTARHLNGEADPPRGLVALFDEIEEVPELNIRELPARIREKRSARSAPSASGERDEAQADEPEEHQPDPTDAPDAGEGRPDAGLGRPDSGEGRPDAWIPAGAGSVVHARLPEGPAPTR